MRVLHNTTQIPAMNDVSVTAGNADGWIILTREAAVEKIERDDSPPSRAQVPLEKKPASPETKRKRSGS